MKVVTVKVPKRMDDELERVRMNAFLSKSEVIREAVERHLRDQGCEEGSEYELETKDCVISFKLEEEAYEKLVEKAQKCKHSVNEEVRLAIAKLIRELAGDNKQYVLRRKVRGL